MKVVTYIAEFLKEKEIDIVFELQGGMITRIIDEIHRMGKTTIVSMHHEQAAAFAVDAYGRVKNKPGIALATSGPGATNLITGIGNCYFDSVPAIFITGQVNTSEQKGNIPVRQIGFQETDIVSIVKPITKAAFKIENASEIPAALNDAWNISLSGRQGPVLIDIPMNIQHGELEEDPPALSATENEFDALENVHNFIENYSKHLKEKKKPLVLIGRGVRASGSQEQFINFITKAGIPVVSSLHGLDVLPYDHPQRIGFIGTYGNRWANYALGECDLLLVLGSRLDLRQTGSETESFQKNKTIFHLDIDKNELNNRLSGCYTLNSDLKFFFEAVSNKDFSLHDSVDQWLATLETVRSKFPDTNELKDISGINPNSFLHQLSRRSNKAGIYTVDVGNNQMWSAQSLEISEGQLFLTSGGMGAMGYALPAAIGACYANDNKAVVCITGDGGFQINIQELQTVFRNKLPIKIIVLNNHCLGMIRQFQDKYFESCYQSTVWGYSHPDFVQIAKAYNIEAYSISDVSEIEHGLDLMWSSPESPFLLNVNIDVHTNVFPKMLYGNPISKMEPEVD